MGAKDIVKHAIDLTTQKQNIKICNSDNYTEYKEMLGRGFRVN